VAAVLLLALIVWIGVSTSALGLAFLQRPGAHPTATRTTAPTARPTVTSTAMATRSPATATSNPQAILDREARASFRAITLAPFVDNTCSPANARTNFGPNNTVYVNLCVAANPANGPVSVYLRQNGQVLFVLQSGFLSPGSVYWYSRAGFGMGQFDILVVQRINGIDATAADISFTVS
jgi:hypothetical protein